MRSSPAVPSLAFPPFVKCKTADTFWRLMDPFACKELQSLEREAGGVADVQTRLVAEKVCECVHGDTLGV
jgi:hypothetical protein